MTVAWLRPPASTRMRGWLITGWELAREKNCNTIGFSTTLPGARRTTAPSSMKAVFSAVNGENSTPTRRPSGPPTASWFSASAWESGNTATPAGSSPRSDSAGAKTPSTKASRCASIGSDSAAAVAGENSALPFKVKSPRAMARTSVYFHCSSRRVGNPVPRNAPTRPDAARRSSSAHAPASHCVGRCARRNVREKWSLLRFERHSCDGLLHDPVIAARFEFAGQFGISALGDAAVDQHVDKIGDHVVEQPLVVGYQQNGAIFTAQAVDTISDDTHGIDIEAGVNLVEHGKLGLEHKHLQNLVALFLATGEAFVDRALQEAGIHLHLRQLLSHQLEELRSRHLILAAGFTLGLER